MTTPQSDTRASAVALHDITARYRRRGAVLSGLSWNVPRGRTLLLGPNGAGKSTLLKVAAGILRPASGDVARAEGTTVGYLSQSSPQVPGLDVLGQVTYAGWLQGMRQHEARSAAREALGLVHLDDYLTRRTTDLSGGQARRLNLACAIVASPATVLLDEPTTGLDPVEREAFAEIISAELPATSIVLATHEAEAVIGVADHVAILVGGRIVDQFSARDPEIS